MATVALPIETKVREFDGKLWLGLNLINNGHSVILGPSDEVSSSSDITKPDIYIMKDPGDSSVDFADKLQSAGITVCGLDTEGGVFGAIDQYTQNKKQILNHLDAFFVWGNQQAKAVQRHYKKACENLHVTGNPRFDLLQPNYRSYYDKLAASHRSEYDEYVLVNGNFSIANPYGEQVISNAEEIDGKIESQKHVYNSRIFHLFLDAIYHIASEIEDITVIMRPHPSEDNTTYEREFARHNNIVVKDSGDVRTWIAGAQATIHHDCTTGIESALMGVPTVSYRPIQKKEYVSQLPIFVSAEAYTPNELAKYISESITSNDPYGLTDKQTKYLKQYFHNIDQLAAESISNIVNRLKLRENKPNNTLKPGFYARLERRIKSSQWNNQAVTVYDTVHQLIGDSSPRDRRQYRNQKFPELTKDEIDRSIYHLGSFLKNDPININKVPLTADTFYLYK